MEQRTNITDLLVQAAHHTRDVPSHTIKTISDKAVKLGEEVGEFNQAVLFEQGKLPHKNITESAAGEGADIMLCIIDVLAKLYPHESPEGLMRIMENEIARKLIKWKELKA